MNEERAERRRAALRQSAQRRRRHDAQSRSGAGREAGLSAFTYQLVRGASEADAPSATTHTPRRSSSSERGGLPVEPHWTALRRHRGARRVLRGVGREAARVSASTPTASSSRSTTIEQRRRLGTTSKFPALGDRVQVPGRAEDHAAQADRGQRRPHRRGDAVRGARTGVRRRHDRLDGDAAQRRRHRAQGHPRPATG